MSYRGLSSPIIFVLTTILWICSGSVYAATPEEVDACLSKAKAFLYNEQKQGNWEWKQSITPEMIKAAPNDIIGGQWAGMTALATYALLASGDSPQDPRLAPAIAYLQKAEVKGTYALGMKTQLYTLLPATPALKVLASNDAKLLRESMLTEPESRGLYDYVLNNPKSRRVDHSVSQYGVLGTWAIERAGVEVPSKYWQTVEEAWIRDQDASGGWAYGKVPIADHGITVSMTAAGIATLFITQDYLHADNGILCKGNVVNPHIDAGLKWMGEHFNDLFNQQNDFNPYYGLYGIERIGVASGYKYFGSVNWYEAGADFLVHKQMDNGEWPGGVQSTSLGVLFLSRARAPVVFNKLEYDVKARPGNWNERPRDAANLTHWISKQIERDLNWQIVNLQAPVRELHDAPILYLSGNQVLQFSDAELLKLKQFCEEGGMILGSADCATVAFSNSFKKFGSQLFPSYEFRELPAEHPIYTSEQYQRSKWKTPPKVLGLSNGVRELMVLLPMGDPGRYWQTQEVGGHEPFYQLADNIFLYAVDQKNLTQKGKTYLVDLDLAVKADRQLKIVRLQYDGNWDPEPAGWHRLAAILHNQSHVDLEILPLKLGKDLAIPADTKIVHLTGTTRFRLEPSTRDKLKAFISTGGTLIIDAAGGSSDFATSAEGELNTIFGADTQAQLTAPLPESTAIYTLPGSTITTFQYRSYTHKMLGSLKGPQIRGITIGGRLAIFYSRHDLSAGLVGEPCDGIVGYEPATATVIMKNIILLAGK